MTDMNVVVMNENFSTVSRSLSNGSDYNVKIVGPTVASSGVR